MASQDSEEDFIRAQFGEVSIEQFAAAAIRVCTGPRRERALRALREQLFEELSQPPPAPPLRARLRLVRRDDADGPEA